MIFTEFSENYIPNLVSGDGDVKYHLGYRTVRKLSSGAEVEIRLSANPSHLEAVDPVVEGTARARQRIRGDTEHRRKVLPLLIHGDAAFAGQGIVAETLNMSQLQGYGTGGTVHVGGEQSDRIHDFSRRRALVDVRHRHRKNDRGADFSCERRRSACEHVRQPDWRSIFARNLDATSSSTCIAIADTGTTRATSPRFTQPDLYAKIDKRPSVTQLYKRELLDAGALTDDDAASLETEFDLRLEMRSTGSKGDREREGGQEGEVQGINCGFSAGIQQLFRLTTAISERNAGDHCRRIWRGSGKFQCSAEDQADA